MYSILAGSAIGVWLLIEKFVRHVGLMENHGPLLVFAAVLIVAGMQLLALGLLGEMHVHHYYEPERKRPYSVDRVLRPESGEQSEASQREREA
jgi:hypothetical protein